MYGESFELNFKKLNKKHKHNKGSSYGLKASKEMSYALSERISIVDMLIKTIKTPKTNHLLEENVFPLAAFDALLEVSSPRNRLFYLVCGGTSARASQALCMTIFDIDTSRKKVYLIDPLTDKRSPLFNHPRNQLLKQYNIDFRVKPYKKIGFKYDIPSENSQDKALTFLPGYESMFFEAFYEWNRHIDRNYPMIFQVTDKDGVHIPSYKSMYVAFKRDIEKVKRKYPHLKQILDNFNNGLHGLRHMYGCAFADYIYYINLPENVKLRNAIKWDFSPEESRQIIKMAMGHSTDKANKLYFKQSRFVFLDMLDRFNNNNRDSIIKDMKKMQLTTFICSSASVKSNA